MFKRILSALCFATFVFLVSSSVLANPQKQILRASERVLDTPFVKSTAYASTLEGERVYTLETGRNTVSVFDSKFRKVAEFASALSSPTTITVDKQGKVFVADFFSGQIVVLSQNGMLLSKFAVPKPISIAALSDGKLAVSSLAGGKLVTIVDEKGTKINSFGDLSLLDKDSVRNRILNHGRVLVDSSDNVYHISEWAANPLVQKFSKKGIALTSFKLQGETANLQAQIAAEARESIPAGKVGGVVLVNSAAISPKTGNLWISINGSTKTETIYEYDPTGKKVGEYLTVISNAEGVNRAASSVKQIVVDSTSVYVFLGRGGYKINPAEKLKLDAVSLEENACPAAQNWGDCKTNCGTEGDTNDDKDCKATLSQYVGGGRVVGSTCSSNRSHCSGSVEICNTETSHIVTMSTSLYCSSGGGGEEW